MTCDRAKELFSELHEETLDKGLRQPLEGHLAGCPSCEHEYGSFKTAYAALSGFSPVSVPEDLSERIARRLDHADWDRKSASKPALRWSLALAGAAAAIFVVLFFRQQPAVGVQMGPGGNASPSAVRVQLLEGKVHLVFQSSEVRTLNVLQGGTALSQIPPTDAKPVRTVRVASGQPYDAELPVIADAEPIWVRTEGDELTTAVFFPQSSKSASVTGNVAEMLQALAGTYGVTVHARLKGPGPTMNWDLSSPTWKGALPQLRQAGYDAFESKDRIIHVLPR